DHVAISGIFAPTFAGIGVSAVGAGTNVTVQNSTFSSIGNTGGAAVAGAAVKLFGNTYTGKGAGFFLDYFAEIIDGSSAVISGNRVTNNQGVDAGGNNSAAVAVAQGAGSTNPIISAQIFGNDFHGNLVGVAVGSDGTTDTSAADIQYNNLSGNLT